MWMFSPTSVHFCQKASTTKNEMRAEVLQYCRYYCLLRCLYSHYTCMWFKPWGKGFSWIELYWGEKHTFSAVFFLNASLWTNLNLSDTYVSCTRHSMCTAYSIPVFHALPLFDQSLVLTVLSGGCSAWTLLCVWTYFSSNLHTNYLFPLFFSHLFTPLLFI